MGRCSQIRDRRRFLRQAEAQVRRLKRKLAKIRVFSESRAIRKRVAELTQLIAEKRAAISDVMTAEQIAAAILRSRRWVTSIAPDIPGAHFSKNRHLLPEIKHSHPVDKGRASHQRTGPENDCRRPVVGVPLDPLPLPRPIALPARLRRCLVFNPFDEWEPTTRDDFIRQFNSLIKGIEQAIQ